MKEAHNESEDSPMRGCVLVVDDEKNIRRTLRMVLEDEGADVFEASTGEEALTRLRDSAKSNDASTIDVLLIDVRLPGKSGIEVLEEITRDDSLPKLPVILISGHASVSDAAYATRLGAFDFFEKPLVRDRILVSVRNAFQRERLERELRLLRERVNGSIIGDSQPIKKLLAQLTRVGSTKARVLITGESGTGKELVARAIHAASDRANAPFVKVNCAAIPSELIESELFGHERGAFTGASSAKKGLFELAHTGTILLDEIGDMNLNAQAKVLRVIQEGEMMRVGAERPMNVDVRILASTHRNLAALVQTNEFREDLYFRLNVVPIHVPALRERPEDIPSLVNYFVAQSCAQNGVSPREISHEALVCLCNYAWPGNVRELQNIVERMVVLSESDLSEIDVPDYVRQASVDKANGLTGSDTNKTSTPTDFRYLLELTQATPPLPLKSMREAVERIYIRTQLAANRWNVSRTADILDLERTHLHRKMKSLNISRDSETE